MISRPRKVREFPHTPTITAKRVIDEDGRETLVYVPEQKRDLGVIDFYTVENMRANGLQVGQIHVGSISRIDASNGEDMLLQRLESFYEESLKPIDNE